ncbi:predicted protein [Arabidopsis lyrata subsp. lyrata]|uniref:Predicted protein n=1 Tax=Arabidopsis lyrata subsp. lyrata TaxID=81972 RepID=D7M115_ARALL|nr:predicted protein [Arabidopsis lyrata subsp. lyrata]
MSSTSVGSSHRLIVLDLPTMDAISLANLESKDLASTGYSRLALRLLSSSKFYACGDVVWYLFIHKLCINIVSKLDMFQE